jgi:hypothetical protein
MQITLTWTTVIAAAGGIAALVAIIGYLVKVIVWFQRQKQQDREIVAIKEEQQLLTYGVLACLKGLKEQGCNGPVTEAINKIEKHINAAAHAAQS